MSSEQRETTAIFGRERREGESRLVSNVDPCLLVDNLESAATAAASDISEVAAMHVVAQPSTILLTEKPRLLRLSSPRLAISVNVLRQTNVGNVGGFIANNVDIRVQHRCVQLMLPRCTC